jgi:serine/threonine-protein kinase
MVAAVTAERVGTGPVGDGITAYHRGTMTSAPERNRGLPPVVVEHAATRFGHLALFTALALPALHLARAAVQPALVESAFNPINRLVLLAAVLASAALFAARQFRLAAPSIVLRLGLMWQSLIAFALALVETARPPGMEGPALGISAVGPWILIVSGLVPNRPQRALVAALAAATAWPLAYIVNAARGMAATQSDVWLLWPLLNYAMAGLAYFVGRGTESAVVQTEASDDLGGYRLESRIGEGGMGEVWKASHKLLARTAAVKIIRPDVLEQEDRAADTAAARFKREANVIAKLQSPHTVFLYDFGIAKDGRFYYVMELLEGVSLQALVAESGPLAPARAVYLLSQMCESLHEAHERGLVHRDLKPSNIMVCELALTFDFVKVLDFGLAKTLGDSGMTQLTMAGTSTGTPGYMAPEIALAEDSIDRRADVYALGCVAYFLLTGTTVFEEENPTRMALKHVQEVPDTPSARSSVAIPPALESLVMQCLEKQPADRPASMAAVAERLAQCGVEPWTSADAREWWKQRGR